MNETRALILDSARRLFADHGAADALQQARRERWSPRLWAALEAAGMTRLTLPEARGGAGCAPADAAALLRLAGAHAAPVPYAETAWLAAWMLEASGVTMPGGPLSVAPVRGEALTARRDGAHWVFGGRAAGVPYASCAGAIVVLADSVDGRCVALLEPQAARLEPGRNLAGEPRDRVDLDGVRIPDAQVHAAGREVTPRALRRRGALARALATCGALERALELTLEHARTRVQFGRRIGQFQAIQQELAKMAGEIAAARAAAESAVAALGRDDELIAVASAKIRAAEAAGVAAMIAHQVHGAIGATEEYALHHYTLRAWAWREEFGNEALWAAELGRSILREGAERLWPALTRATAPPPVR
jgi:acyl-CoA dehydrogenase